MDLRRTSAALAIVLVGLALAAPPAGAKPAAHKPSKPKPCKPHGHKRKPAPCKPKPTQPPPATTAPEADAPPAGSISWQAWDPVNHLWMICAVDGVQQSPPYQCWDPNSGDNAWRPCPATSNPSHCAP